MNQNVVLTFSENFTDNKLKLFHFPPEILDLILQQNSDFEIKGEKDGNAFFITKEKTFRIVKYETSNCLLLKNEDSIEGEVDCHFEIEEISPDLSSIVELLKQNYFTENGENSTPSETKNRKNSSFSFQDLQNRVVASEKEIKQKLESIGAFEVEGYWRLIDPKWTESTLDLLLLLIHEKGWNLKELSKKEILKELKNENPQVLDQCFSIYGKHLNEDLKEIHFEKIAKFRAHQLFSQKNV
jgi:hypothetical protein